ncbi:uncharacterized protein METZ01_LOCUS241867, partial [marine metagenome]
MKRQLLIMSLMCCTLVFGQNNLAKTIVDGLHRIPLPGNNASDKYGKDGAPVVRALPDYRVPSGRTEEYELYLTDSYGDGWNGAAVDLSVNGTVVITGATIADGDEASYYFDVDDFDYVATSWTSGTYDSECTYGIYDAEGYLVIESGAGDISLSIDFSGDNIQANGGFEGEFADWEGYPHMN